MGKTLNVALALAAGLVAGIAVGSRIGSGSGGEAATTSTSFSAVADAIGAEDISGPYEVVEGWPKDLSTLPGHEKWTYGGARGIFAESPNRVYLLGGGELPNIPRPQTKLSARYRAERSISARRAAVAQRQHRNAAGRRRIGPGSCEGNGDLERLVAALSRAGRRRPLGTLSHRRRRDRATSSKSGRSGTSMFKRPHAVYVSPYDAQKHVWVVDDHTHAIYKFTNDGKKLRADDRDARTCQAPMRRISTGRRSWRGCPTGVSTSPTDITARASRSSMRTASSCWTSACQANPGRKRVPDI